MPRWQANSKRLFVERLESRLLLTAAMGDLCDSVASTEVIATESQPSAENDIYRSARGIVGWFDPSDTFRIDIEDHSEIAVNLDGLRNNADLVLTNAQGQIIEASTNRGTAAESLDVVLQAGTYYASVRARSWSWTTFNLGVHIRPIEPPNPAPAESAPTTSRPSEPPPTASPSPASPPAAPATPTLTNPTLSSVAYYGTRIDWNVNAINAPEAWNAGYTGVGVTVAVIDTGVDRHHPELAGSIWVNRGEISGDGIDNDGNGFVDDLNGWNFADKNNNTTDGNGHGTHVAGTIAAARNGQGTTGVAYDAQIMPIRVLSDDGRGTSWAVAAGIRYAVDNGADVINMSLGGGGSSRIFAALQYASAQGVFVVVAAGNDGSATPSHPAIESRQLDILSVGAHDQDDRRASFSNGVGTSGAVQVAAPGVSIVSTLPGNRNGQYSGTSMAAPHVAGIAALALSANPDLTPTALRQLITFGTSRTIARADSLGGVNAAITVGYASSGMTSVGTNGVADPPTSRESVADISTIQSQMARVRHAPTVMSGTSRGVPEKEPAPSHVQPNEVLVDQVATIGSGPSDVGRFFAPNAAHARALAELGRGELSSRTSDLERLLDLLATQNETASHSEAVRCAG